jgi:hypothetical protein
MIRPVFTWEVVVHGSWTFQQTIVVAAYAEEPARAKALELVRNALPWGAGDAEVEISEVRQRP